MGSSSDTELTLSGSGPENGVVIINDNGKPIGPASVKGYGTWKTIVSAHAVGSKVRTVHG